MHAVPYSYLLHNAVGGIEFSEHVGDVYNVVVSGPLVQKGSCSLEVFLSPADETLAFGGGSQFTCYAVSVGEIGEKALLNHHGVISQNIPC